MSKDKGKYGKDLPRIKFAKSISDEETFFKR
jgi:hypothetical protein